MHGVCLGAVRIACSLRTRCKTIHSCAHACRRGIEPCKGLWTVPAGFMELSESTAEGAARRVRGVMSQYVQCCAIGYYTIFCCDCVVYLSPTSDFLCWALPGMWAQAVCPIMDWVDAGRLYSKSGVLSRPTSSFHVYSDGDGCGVFRHRSMLVVYVYRCACARVGRQTMQWASMHCKESV